MKHFTRRAATLALGIATLLAVPVTAIEPQYERQFPQPTAGGEVWIRTELYFGTDKPGDNVTDAQFRDFVDQQVTPRFPDGLTLLTGYGQFLNSNNRLIKERSKLLILFYPQELKGANRKIEDIRDLYKKRFQQESVLRADSRNVISF